MKLKSPGFTLIELTLVTVIILALVGLSVPLFKRTFSDISAKETAFNISKLVSYAQEKAAIDRKIYMIMFDFNRRQYQIFEVIQSGEKTSYVKAQGRFGKAFALPQGLSFYDPKADTTLKAGEEYRKQVLFYPDGHCSELFIELIDNTGSGYGITLKGFGSMARIKEVTRER